MSNLTVTNLIASQFKNFPVVKQLKCPQTDDCMDEKDVVYRHNGLLLIN